jgi:hypothetical protein
MAMFWALIALASLAMATPVPSAVTDTAIPAASSLSTPVPVAQSNQGTSPLSIYKYTTNLIMIGGSSANDYHSPAWLPNGDWSLHAGMDQSKTNGGAKWGTFDAPTLSHWLETAGQPMPQGKPWGGADASHTNPYKECPNTGMTRRYEFTISEGVIAPDGVEKQAVLVNGQFPGPLIEVCCCCASHHFITTLIVFLRPTGAIG